MYWRVSRLACSTASASAISPLRCRISHGTPCAFIAGRLGSSLRAASARTSSSAPAAIMASKRASMRRRSSSRSGIRKTFAARARSTRRRLILLVPVEQRTAGRQHDFERAGDAGAIAGLQARRRGGIARGELGVQRGDAFAGQPRAHPSRISAGIGGTAASPRVSALK